MFFETIISCEFNGTLWTLYFFTKVGQLMPFKCGTLLKGFIAKLAWKFSLLLMHITLVSFQGTIGCEGFVALITYFFQIFIVGHFMIPQCTWGWKRFLANHTFIFVSNPVHWDHVGSSMGSVFESSITEPARVLFLKNGLMKINIKLSMFVYKEAIAFQGDLNV